MNDASQLAECFPLGTHLKEEIEAHGFTLEEFAKAAYLPYDRVQAIVQEYSYATFKECDRMAGVLGVSTEMLLRLQLSYLRWKKANNIKDVEPNG